MLKIRIGGICYWWDTFAIPADVHLLNGYVLVGYVLNQYVLVGYVWVGYVWNGYVWDMWDTC